MTFMSWKEDFVRKMFVEKEYESGIELYLNNVPETLFRYRQGNKNDIDALKSNKIWFSNMKNVNDKFEGKFIISYDKLHLHFDFLQEYLESKVEEMLEYIIGQFYICCFCESVQKDNMWAYYADNNKGFCIEYYVDSFESPYFIFPVTYKDKKEYIEDIDEDTIRRSILIKNCKWKSEDEWRIAVPFNNKDSKGNFIEQPLPKAIYMGADMESSLRDYLFEYCTERLIELYQMKLDNKNMELNPERIL